MKSIVIPVRYSKKDVGEIDLLVKHGYYSSRSEAIKDMSRLGKAELLRQRVLRTIQETFGSVKRDKEKSAAKLGREARNALWQDFFKKAKGDEKKALDMLLEEINLETHR
jgi:Arc/MetJ-type ribon-helix-helix transcriptional regulator